MKPQIIQINIDKRHSRNIELQIQNCKMKKENNFAFFIYYSNLRPIKMFFEK